MQTAYSLIMVQIMKKKLYFENLDGLRFWSFLFIFFHHAFHTDIPALKANSLRISAELLFAHADLAVHFFFLLSGFLITYLLLNEQELKGRIHLSYFYMRRILRIWPLYFASLIFGFILFPLLKSFLGGVPEETASPWLYGLFLSNFNDLWYGLPDASSLSVLWSVAIEEQFYLVWPLLLYFFPRRFYPLIFTSILLFSFAYRFHVAPDKMALKYHTFSAINDMCMGGLIAYYTFFSPKFKQFFEEAPKWLNLLVYGVGLLMLIFKNDLFTTPLLMSLDRLLFSLVFAYILLEQVFCKNSLFKVGNFSFATYWGRYTYGLYCLHFIGILIALNISKILGTHTTLFGVLVWETFLSLAIAMLLSWLSFHFMESYFLRWKERFAYILKDKKS